MFQGTKALVACRTPSWMARVVYNMKLLRQDITSSAPVNGPGNNSVPRRWKVAISVFGTLQHLAGRAKCVCDQRTGR